MTSISPSLPPMADLRWRCRYDARMTDDVDKVASPDPEGRREFWTPALPPPELSDADADAVLLRLRERAVYGQLANKLAVAGREVEKAHFADAGRVKIGRAHV